MFNLDGAGVKIGDAETIGDAEKVIIMGISLVVSGPGVIQVL